MLALTAFSSLTVAESQKAVIRPNETVLISLVFFPFLAALSIPFIYKFLKNRISYFSAGVSASCFIAMLSIYGSQGAVSIPWIPSLGISLTFYVDGLATLMGLLVTGVGTLVMIYSSSYMENADRKPKYYASLLAFMGSMLGVVFSGDLIMLFVFWELTSVTSFLLIGYRQDESAKYAARKSMIITVGGALFMLASFLMINSVTGTFSLIEMLSHPEAVQQELRTAGLFLPVLFSMVVGAAAKSAQVPFHIWLPNAMEAPTPVSAFLHSATMVKAGVFLLARFRPVLVSSEWSMILVPLGLLTMTVAGILAVASTDIKELLAYSTASHLGLIVAALGFTSGLGAEAAGFHILNHALFKASLFLVAGIVAHEAGTRVIGELGGLKHDLPLTAFIAVVAGLAMGGVPPFNGFQSKELLFEASWHAATHAGGFVWLAPMVAVLGSIFTFIYSIKFVSLFFGEKPASLEHVHRPSKKMVVPAVWLMVGVLFTTVFPQAAVDLVVQGVIESAAIEAHHLHVSLIPHLSPALGMSLVTLGFGALCFRYYEMIHNGVNSFLVENPYFQVNWWYDSLLREAELFSGELAQFIHHGHLRKYLSKVVGGFAVFGLAGYVAASVSLPPLGVEIGLATILVLGVAVTAGFASIRSKSHISGVLTLSVIGATIAIFYILARAPDLALTQLVVETLSLIIFLLVLDRLPSFYGSIKRSRMVTDSVLSIFVGSAVSVTVLLATSGTPDSISQYFIENAVGKGGGTNIVNVILVDFRGFDTMGEITVVSMTALAIVTLIGMRGRYPWFKKDEETRMKADKEEKETGQRTLDDLIGGGASE